MDGMKHWQFTDPYNWCDSRCERCVVEPRCKLSNRLKGRRWVHEMRGEDPDSPEAHVEDMMEDLESAQRMLEQMIEEEGIDLNAEMRKPNTNPVSVPALRLQEASTRLIRAIGREGAPELSNPSVLLHMKLSNLACRVEHTRRDDPEEEAMQLADGTAPMFFLVERLRADIDAAIVADARPAVLAAVADIDRYLAMIAPSVEPYRVELAERIANDEAPPPFIVLPHPLPSVDEPAANDPA